MKTYKKEYIRLSSRFSYDSINKSLIDIDTGEIYTKQDQVEDILNTLKEDKEFNSAMERKLREEFGLPEGIEKNQYRWKSNSWFVKIYRTEMRKYKKKVQLSPSAGLLLFYLQDYIEFQSNQIIIEKGKPPTNKDMKDLTGLSGKTLNKALNELEGNLFIIRVGTTHSREIYFNPYLACSGNEVLKSTVKLFDMYEPITPY